MNKIAMTLLALTLAAGLVLGGCAGGVGPAAPEETVPATEATQATEASAPPESAAEPEDAPGESAGEASAPEAAAPQLADEAADEDPDGAAAAESSGEEQPDTETASEPEVAGLAADGSVPETADVAFDAEEVVNVRIKVVDKNGSPVPNICVNLAYVDGEEGTYTPGDAVTKSGGAVVRQVHPQAVYAVILTDRQQLDYTEKTKRNQSVHPMTVKRDGPREFTFVWEYKTPRELDLADANKVTFSFLDPDGKPLPDLWVSMFPAGDTSPEPRQIVPGITDSQGKVYWTAPETGTFEMAAILFLDEQENSMFIDTFTVTVDAVGKEYQFNWVPEHPDDEAE